MKSVLIVLFMCITLGVCAQEKKENVIFSNIASSLTTKIEYPIKNRGCEIGFNVILLIDELTQEKTSYLQAGVASLDKSSIGIIEIEEFDDIIKSLQFFKEYMANNKTPNNKTPNNNIISRYISKNNIEIGIYYTFKWVLYFEVGSNTRILATTRTDSLIEILNESRIKIKELTK